MRCRIRISDVSRRSGLKPSTYPSVDLKLLHQRLLLGTLSIGLAFLYDRGEPGHGRRAESPCRSEGRSRSRSGENAPSRCTEHFELECVCVFCEDHCVCAEDSQRQSKTRWDDRGSMYNKKGRSHPEGGCPALPLSRRMTSREFLHFSDRICVSHSADRSLYARKYPKNRDKSGRIGSINSHSCL